MQEIHLLNTNQLFTTTTTNNSIPNTSIDRHLRHTHLQNQALKCPRCDSLNTKFCYYNNYNLSQPRHFCKSCRRYWTKGGVLRNVPIGGGCRKSSKRSSASVKESKLSDEVRSKRKSNNSNSSSESSSMTVNGIAAVGGGLTAAEISPSAPTPPYTDSVIGKHIFAQIRNPNFSPDLIYSAGLCCETGGDIDGDGSGGGGFAGNGSFSNINDETTPFNFKAKSYNVVSDYQQFDRPYEQWQLSTEEGLGRGYIDPTVQMDQNTNIGSEPLNWHQEPQQQHHMFGLTPAVDQGYWSQQQWSNNAHHLYLP